MSAGYSGTPLPAKLGIKPGSKVLAINAPADLLDILQPWPDGASLTTVNKGVYDVILFFTDKKAHFERSLPTLMKRMKPASGLWIAWPKKASKLATDVTEDVIRALALPKGLVDNKVCAIDDTWSGLRLVIRRELR